MFPSPFAFVCCLCGYLSGALLCTLARRLLRLPVHRYVDDFFAGDRAELCEHAMGCFVRLVRACLGDSAAADEKCAVGNPLVVLGVETHILDSGIRFRPESAKMRKWAMRIASYLQADRLTGGEAAKLAGALQWASQHAFRRLGRAMIRAIYRRGVRVLCVPSMLLRLACSVQAEAVTEQQAGP